MFLEISGTRSRPSVSTQSQRLGGSVTPNNPDVRLVSLNGNQVVQASRDHLDRRAEVNARNIWNQGETLTFTGRVRFGQNVPSSAYVTQFKESYNGTSEGNLPGSVRVQNGRLSILGLRGSVPIQRDQWIDYRIVATRDRNYRGSLTGWLNGQQVGVARNVQFGRRNQAHNVKFGLYGGANRTSQTQVVYHDDVTVSVDPLTGSRTNGPLVGQNPRPSRPNQVVRHQINPWSPTTIANFDSNDEIEINARAFNIARGPIGDRFTYGSRAQDSGDRFIFDRNSGDLFFDRDGSNGRYGQQLIARAVFVGLDSGDIRVV